MASGKASKICYRRENLPKTINHHQAEVCITRPSPLFPCNCLLVEGGGFEPPKVEPADLQSAPFDHSGTPPKIKPRILRERNATVNRNHLIRHKKSGAGGRNRTPDLLITNQLLYQLSYTSINSIVTARHSGSCPRFASADPGPASCRSFVGLRMSTGHSVPHHPKSHYR